MLHKTIQKITKDIETLSFNTAIAQMMIFMNHMSDAQCRSREILEPFLKLLAPFAPHIAEELWLQCIVPKGTNPEVEGYPFISLAAWPAFDPALVIDDEMTLGVQVNGKLRGEITVSRTATQDDAVKLALGQDPVRAAIGEKEPKKIVYVPGRILNFVV
jgi:leucyl-tRNA synthetase